MLDEFIYIFPDYRIKQRHNFLIATFGTKPEEDISYHNSNTLAIAATVSMVILSILEPASYYLYNRKVSVGIIKPQIMNCVNF